MWSTTNTARLWACIHRLPCVVAGVLCLLAVAAGPAAAYAAQAAVGGVVLHVAPDGDDRWSGTLPSPNAQRTDGPLATLNGARDAVRGRRMAAAGGDVGPVTVRVRGGNFDMDAPFVLEPQDSGTAASPIVYQADADQRPVFSGGRVITGFRQNGPLWEVTLPEVKEGKWYFRQLFVAGQRRQRSRSPNAGYHRIAEALPGPKDAQGKAISRDTFRFAADDIKPSPGLEDVNLVLMHSWETSIHSLKSVDPIQRIVQFTSPLREWWCIGYWEKNQRYYLENAREFLDQPGEWYLDRKTGVLAYWPMPGEQINQTQVIAPRLTELVRLAGDADKGRFVDHITLRGLSFHHADWVLLPQGNSSTQAAVDVPAAVIADGARNCAIESCEVAHVGTYGIWFRRGCKDGRVQRNRLFDLGAGGIRVGEATMAKADVGESTRILVDNNHIYDGGHVFAAGIGIWLAQASNNTISHNDVHDMMYSGMSIGWNWNDTPNRTHHNTIEFNHVHHVGKGVLSDCGLIYCLGVSPGSVIRNNLFHDNWPYEQPPFGWGIYLDATCGGYLVENNVVYNTRSGGLMYNNGGHEHIIRNNIFALSADYALWPYWEKRPNTFQHNIVYMTQGELFVPFAQNSLRERLAGKQAVGEWAGNVYWHTAKADSLRFFRHDLADWRKQGLDETSLLADPLFANPDQYDFSLKPDSPALKLGFKPIDISTAGLYGDAAWMNEARSLRFPKTVFPPPPPGQRPTEVDDNFEDTPVGNPPRAAQADPEAEGASIKVTDQQAAAGKHSLKFTDSKTLQPSWKPHMYYQPHITTGQVRLCFDIRLEEGAKLFTEWRDEMAYPGNTGPSISFDPPGRISAAGKLLTTVPISQWIHIDIEASVGPQAPRAFTLAITPPTGQTQTFPDLPIAGADFRELHWLGFSSTAAADCVFHLDNIRVQRLTTN